MQLHASGHDHRDDDIIFQRLNSQVGDHNPDRRHPSLAKGQQQRRHDAKERAQKGNYFQNAGNDPQDQCIRETEDRPHEQENQHTNCHHAHQRRRGPLRYQHSDASPDDRCLIVVALGYQGKQSPEDRTRIQERIGHSEEDCHQDDQQLSHVERHRSETASDAVHHVVQTRTNRARLGGRCRQIRFGVRRQRHGAGGGGFSLACRHFGVCYLQGDLRLQFRLGLHGLLFHANEWLLQSFPVEGDLVRERPDRVCHRPEECPSSQGNRQKKSHQEQARREPAPPPQPPHPGDDGIEGKGDQQNEEERQEDGSQQPERLHEGEQSRAQNQVESQRLRFRAGLGLRLTVWFSRCHLSLGWMSLPCGPANFKRPAPMMSISAKPKPDRRGEKEAFSDQSPLKAGARTDRTGRPRSLPRQRPGPWPDTGAGARLCWWPGRPRRSFFDVVNEVPATLQALASRWRASLTPSPATSAVAATKARASSASRPMSLRIAFVCRFICVLVLDYGWFDSLVYWAVTVTTNTVEAGLPVVGVPVTTRGSHPARRPGEPGCDIAPRACRSL
jgi:hypothetical protein